MKLGLVLSIPENCVVAPKLKSRSLRVLVGIWLVGYEGGPRCAGPN